MDADAFVMYSADKSGKLMSITMKGVSPLTDFSYNFHGLNSMKVHEKQSSTKSVFQSSGVKEAVNR